MIERPISTWVKRNRKPASLSGNAHRPGGDWVRVHMTNLSYEGCHLLTDQDLDIGETLMLMMPGMQAVSAQVRWVKDGEAGVRFVQGNAADERRSRIGV